MRQVYAGIVLLIAGLSAVGCGAQPAETPAAVETLPGEEPQAEATSESTGGDTGAQTTGIGIVDEVIAAVLSGDGDVTYPLISFTTAGCTTAEGLGGPPKCLPGQPEGDPVNYLPVLGPGEGVTVPPDEISSLLPFPVESLYGVYRVPDDALEEPGWPVGEYGLVFASTDSFTPALTLRVDEGGIVRADYHMEQPGEVLERDAGEVILGPSG
jgi:hypothetical protein